MIISPDKKGTLDNVAMSLLNKINIDVPLVLMNTYSDFEFNQDLFKLDKWVLVDFSELGANSPDQKNTLLWGRNAELFERTQNEEWKKFDNFVKEKPPLLIFKREVLCKDVKENIHPIDFPSFLQDYPVQTKQDFDARKIDLFNFWGYSHELRRMLHGEIFINAVRRDRCVIDNFSHLEQELKDNRKKWVSIFTPWYARFPMEQIMYVNGLSKLSVSSPGAGCKCFRHTQVSANSVMVMRDDPMAWSFPWESNFNCIKFPVSEDMKDIRGLNGAAHVIEIIEKALENPDLYEIYRQGILTYSKYRIDLYVKEYLEPIIKNYL